MGQMTNKQARVIDPILSAVARGYRQLDLVGMYLFPRVPVRQRGGQIITFGVEDFMAYNNIERAPGQNTKRIQFGHAGSAFALKDYSLEGQVPYETEEEAEAVPGIDMSARTVRGVQNIIALRLEVAQATLATTAANYDSSHKVTLSSTAQWSDYSGVSHPIVDVETAKEAIRTSTGQYPNEMVIGASVFAKLKSHPDITDRLKYTQSAIATLAILAALFDVPNVRVGRTIKASDASVFSDVWGKDVVLAYTPIADLQSEGEPSYGYTYQLENYPKVEEPYSDRNAKSWIYPVTDVCAPVIAGATSGYVIKAAVA